MALIRQKGKSDCGIAALAMLCDVSYEEAERAIPWRRWGVSRGTDTKQLKEGAFNLAYIGMGTAQGRLRPCGKKSWQDLPDNSLVKVLNPDNPFESHWVVWRKRKIYDPARGVFKPKAFAWPPSSYMKFVPEGMVCPKCEHELIAKWSGVKCSNCSYWFCY